MAVATKQSSPVGVKAKLKDAFEVSIKSGDFSTFQQAAKGVRGLMNETDLRSGMELSVRQVLQQLLADEKTEIQLLERLFQFAINVALADLCPGNLPVLVLSDMLDGSSLSKCETIFTFVESRAEVFKKDIFFKACKNHLLRSCNDLLRRLSRSHDTVFCGRILLFLARIFPLSERSGLNIISEFNLDNVTIVSSKEQVLSAQKEVPKQQTEGLTRKLPKPADYNLYRKFWNMQEYFRNPTSCYNKLQWRHFTTYANEVLVTFGSFKSERSEWKTTAASTSSDSGETFGYFAKYLTSPKLLELELSDSSFRRCLLVQFLILFQYLQSTVKFKQESYILTDEQSVWIKEATDKVFKLISETPPDGPIFTETIKKVLKREEYWNTWKNEGCPDFKTVNEKTEPKRPKQRPKLSELLRQPGNIIVGNKALNELWNVCPDNWEACRSKKRKFVPSMERFFETAIQETDPNNQIEPQYKQVNDSKFSWKAIRLLGMKSPHFFSVNNIQYKQTSDYIEAMILKIPKEKSEEAEDADDAEAATIADETIEDANDEMLHSSDEGSPEKEEV